MIDRFSRRIMEHIADSRYRPRGVEDLAAELGIGDDEVDEFRRSVQTLIEGGQVLMGAASTVALPPPGRQMIGTFRLHERGFGFLVPDSPTEHGDLFVPAGNTGGALTGDRVRAVVQQDRQRAGAGRSPYIGRVAQILQRAERRHVGNLQKRGSQWIVEVDGKLLTQPIVIRDPHVKDAKAGDKVVIELVHYPSQERPGEGVITEVLGEQGEPAVETLAVMRAFGLEERFSERVMEDARVAASRFDDRAVPSEREDLTGQFIVTIDPPDARDYDDAISIRRLEGGGRPGEPVYELGVHIADVSSFVRVGTELDAEAYRRGNSCYLPRKVIPMLPELLSNGVCSLQEGVNRFCKSAFMQYDRDGNVLGARFANTVIRSAKRMTYLEAQALIDEDIREARKHAKTEPKYPRVLVETLKLMDELAKIIRQRRLRQGMIVLGLPEVELVFDDYGRVVDAVPEDNAFTHTLIEMFMVEANEAAARLFDSLRVAMLRRIHPDPPVFDVNELRQFARVAGYNIPANPTRKELQGLLDAVRGKPAQQAVHLAVLRTLSKAEYSPMIIGHFALASEHYTHFTSPIRRYPDLIVHRALDAYLEARQKVQSGPEFARTSQRGQGGQIARLLRDDPRVPDEERLQEISSHCSMTERNAEAAEDELRTYLVLDLLAEHLGEDFAGTVTGVTGMGVFVQLNRYLVDGFVKVNDLPTGRPDDRWQLNRTTGALVAQRSGRTITIGNQFTVRVANVDPSRRRLELVVIEGQLATRKTRKQPYGARQAHKEALRLKQQRRKERMSQRRRKGR